MGKRAKALAFEYKRSQFAKSIFPSGFWLKCLTKKMYYFFSRAEFHGPFDRWCTRMFLIWDGWEIALFFWHYLCNKNNNCKGKEKFRHSNFLIGFGAPFRGAFAYISFRCINIYELGLSLSSRRVCIAFSLVQQNNYVLEIN